MIITDFKIFEHNHKYKVGDIVILNISIYIITKTNYDKSRWKQKFIKAIKIGQISYYQEKIFIKISNESESLFISEIRPLYDYEYERFFETLTIENALEIDNLYNTNFFEELKKFNKNKSVKKFKI